VADAGLGEQPGEFVVGFIEGAADDHLFAARHNFLNEGEDGGGLGDIIAGGAEGERDGAGAAALGTLG